MKKTCVIGGFLLLSLCSAKAMNVYTSCSGPTHTPTSTNYKTVTTSGSTDGNGNNYYNMDCDGDGEAQCCWAVTPFPGYHDFSQSYIDQKVASQIAQNNTSGQIYSNGSAGSYNVQNYLQDQSTMSSFIWNVTVNANNQSAVTIVVIDKYNQ